MRSILFFTTSFVILGFGVIVDAKEFTNRQFWNVQAIRYTDSKQSCLDDVHRWAKNDVQFQCRQHFLKQPEAALLCDRADVDFNDSEYTDRFGTECSTTATLNVK